MPTRRLGKMSETQNQTETKEYRGIKSALNCFVMRIFGLFILTFYPIVLLVDVVFGQFVTGVKVPASQSAREVWMHWREIYWDA